MTLPNDEIDRLERLLADNDRMAAELAAFGPVTAEMLAEAMGIGGGAVNHPEYVIDRLGLLYRQRKP
jgi:hypothetical protein